MFYLDTYINGCLCGLNKTRLHKSNYIIYIDLVVLNMHGCQATAENWEMG